MILAKVRKSRKYKDLGAYSIFILSQDIFDYNVLVKIRKLSHSCYDVLNHQFEIARINLNQLKSDLTDFNLVIPCKNLWELSRILEDDKENIYLHIFNNKVLFKYKDLVFLSRLISGTYPV